MRVFVILTALGLAMPATAQSKLNSKQRKRDAFSELNAKRKTNQGPDAGLALRFFDALTGEPLRGAKVSADGESVMTNAEGRALLKWPAKLNNREDRRIVRVSKSGYVTSDIEVHFMAGTIFNNRFSISPALEPKRVRVVLDWGSSPADLDAHLIKHKRGKSVITSAIATRHRGDAGRSLIEMIEMALDPKPSPFGRSITRVNIPMSWTTTPTITSRNEPVFMTLEQECLCTWTINSRRRFVRQ